MDSSKVNLCMDSSRLDGGLDTILDGIFWKEPELSGQARRFVDHVRDWCMTSSPHRASDWRSYCERSGLTQSQYHNMLKRLRRAGMIEKRYNPSAKEHEFHVSRTFSRSLGGMARSWEEYLCGDL